MSGLRVLRLYHSGVVDEYRERERVLRHEFGHDVHLVCPPAWSEGGSVVEAPATSDVPVHVVPVRGRRHPILFWYASRPLRRLLRELRPDVVDIHEEPYSLATAGILRLVRAEAPDAAICLYTAQNIRKRYPPPFHQLEQRALRTAGAAYPCSTEAGEVLRAKGFSGELHVIPLGVTLPQQLAGDRRDIGLLGRIESYKGTEVAVRAVAALPEEIDSVLELVGSGSQEPQLRALVEELGVPHRVRFVGPVSQDEALERIARYQAVLMPSLTTPGWKEQFGRVAAQALAAGTPVVVSDSGSLPEVVGDAGTVLPEGDAQALSMALQRLLTSPAQHDKMSQAGRRRAASHLTWREVGRLCDTMYREQVAHSRTVKSRRRPAG